MLARNDICACCGQALPPPPSIFDGLRLSAGERRVVEMVRRAGTAGIVCTAIFDGMYGSRLDGGPLSGARVVQVRISRARVKLAAVGKTIVCERPGHHAGLGAGRYVLRDL